MKKRLTAFMMALVLLFSLCACNGNDSPETIGSAPGRMVRKIEVAIHPEDAAFERLYVTQKNMNDLLALLRSMETDQEPEREPDLHDGQSYYTATITFANGEQSVYYLLGHTYLRMGDEPWCVIDTDKAKQFNEFLRTRPTDDGSVPIETTTTPTQTTAPADTTAPTE